MVSRGCGAAERAGVRASAEEADDDTPAVCVADVLRARGAELDEAQKLRYLLLFALRMALLALLVLAFANPFIRRANVGVSGKLLIVVVDDSFSMRAGNRFADAKQAALRVLAAKPGAQKAQVMALGAELQVLTQPVEDAGTLRSAVESIEQSDSKGNYGELGRGLRALAETVHGPVELHLFSGHAADADAGNFADMVLPQNVKLELHPVSGTGVPAPNWTVENVEAPAQIADPKDKRVSRVQAVVAGIGTPAATKTVSLIVNGKTVASKRVDVPANGRAKVELEPLDVPYGFSKCEIRVSGDGGPDAFPADDASVFAVRRRDPEKVAFLHTAGDTRSQLYFGAALAAAAETSFQLQPVNVEQSSDVDPTRYAFVVLSDTGPLPSILENALVQYVKKGGSVLIAAGDELGASRKDSGAGRRRAGGQVLHARGDRLRERAAGGLDASGAGRYGERSARCGQCAGR